MSARRWHRRLARSDFNWRRLLDFRTPEQRGVAVAKFDRTLFDFQQWRLAQKRNPFDVMRAALEAKR